jgi:hypothetical protein
LKPGDSLGVKFPPSIDDVAQPALKENLTMISRPLFAAFLLPCLIGMGAGVASAQEFKVSNKEALPSLQPVVISEPVAVPETIGATLLAGVGFLMMFRRRRY